MALQLPNIYTLGQVKFDTNSLVRLQAQLLAKKQAKEEALNKYYNDLNSKITPAGMHTKDVPGFLERKKELSDYWIQNKNEISKGGLAKQEFDQKYNKLIGDVEQSKSDVKFLYDMRDKEIEEEDLPKLAARSRSIYDPSYYKDPNTRTPYDYSDFTHFVKLPDAAKQSSFWSSIDSDYKPKLKEYEKDEKGNIVYAPTMPGSFTKVAKYTERYAPEQIKAMAENAAELVKFDDGFRKMYRNVLKNPNDPMFVDYKKAYDEYFPGGVMDTPEEVAKASAIIRYKNFLNTGEEKFTDVRGQKAYESALISSRQKAGEREVDLSQYDVLGPYTQAKGVQTRGLFGGLFGGGGKTLVYKKDIDPKDYELIADKDVLPFVDNEGNEYFEVDTSTGDWKAENATISASSVARRNLDRTTLAEEKRGALKFKPFSPVQGKSVPSGKTYNVAGKTFSLDQMKKGASKAGMKLDEYLKSIGAK